MSTEDSAQSGENSRARPAPSSTGPSLLERLLAEQQLLQTPVALFSDAHDRGATPALEPLYRDLIPLSAPGAGEQYAFEVDLDSCSGCKACVAGCHSLNGLDENETWRDVGQLVSTEERYPFSQTVTTACHHCADPACLNGCPVLAYEKDPITGIVRHLDDQCIGCSYCVLKCPYDVPKYNEARGIVRKCDMCHSRLSAGEAPACVQACPTQAIKIVTVITHVGKILQPDTSAFLPQAFDPSYTYPTTRYISKRPLPAGLTGGDHAALKPQPPHWPLVLMLSFMPMAVGSFAVATVLPDAAARLTVIGWLAGAFGLASSVFHLGQPLRAWRIFLGLKRSWLSREAVVFGPWFGLATAASALHVAWLRALASPYVPLASGTLDRLVGPLTTATTLVGILGLFCSVMIYVDTRREFWRFAQTAPRFFGAAAVLGLSSTLSVAPSPKLPLVAGALVATMLLKLAVETRVLRPLDDEDESLTPARKTALLLTERPLRLILAGRYLLAFIGGIGLPITIGAHVVPLSTGWLALGLVLAGEISERYLFFRAVVAPKMPGIVTS